MAGSGKSTAMIALFVTVICALLGATLRNIAAGPGAIREEQQAPTPLLPHDLRSAAAFPGAFKWYFTQRFGFREALIRMHGKLKVGWLGTSSNRQVVLGREGWLYATDDQALDDHRGVRPFTKGELDAWVAALRERTHWLAQRGISCLLVIAPNKETIYPEYLPLRLAPAGATTRLDQLTETLVSAPDISWLDLRPVMSKAREASRIFYRTDTHWNAIGGWFAARAIVDRIPDQHMHPLPDTVVPTALTKTILDGGDLARMLGLAKDLPEEDWWPTPASAALHDDSNAPLTWKTLDVIFRKDVIAMRPNGGLTAVIFRDSFGEALIPWLSPTFGRTVWRWDYGFDHALIERERPSVVIQQLVERKLTTIGPDGNPVAKR